MAIQGPTPDSSEDDDGSVSLFADINITPLTDVILVLLIIFMVSSSAMLDAVREGRLDVDLPGSSAAAEQELEEDAVVVGILRDGTTYVHGRAVSDDSLQGVLEEVRRTQPEASILVEADAEVPHKYVIRVIELLRTIGFPTVGIATETGETTSEER